MKHARYYLGVLEQCDSLYKEGRDQVLEALGRFDRELSQVLLGQARLEELAQDDDEACELGSLYADIAAHLLPLRLSHDDRLRWRQFALSSARRLGDTSAEAAHLVCLGNIYDETGRQSEALAAYEQALRLKDQLDDRRGEAITRVNMAAVYLNLSQPRKALQVLEPLPDTPLGMIVVGGETDPPVDIDGARGGAYLALGDYARALPHLERSLAMASAYGDLRKEGSVAIVLAQACSIENRGEQARALLDRALSIARKIGDRAMAAQVTRHEALLAAATGGPLEEALSRLEKATRLNGEPSDLGRSQLMLAVTAHRVGRLNQAAALYREALVQAESMGNRSYQVAALRGLSSVLSGLGEAREAMMCHERASELEAETGLAGTETAGPASDLFQSLLDAGRPDEARALLERELAAARRSGDLNSEASALGNLGVLLKNLGCYQEAVELQQKSLAVFRQLGDRREEGHTLGDLGVALRHTGQSDAALDSFRQQLAIALELDDPGSQGSALLNMANCLAQSVPAKSEALQHYQRALDLFRRMSNRKGEATVLLNMGSIKYGEGDAQEAARLHEQAFALFRAIGSRRGEGQALFALAMDFYQDGDLTAAIANAEAALPLLAEAGDPVSESARHALEAWKSERDLPKQEAGLSGDKSGEAVALQVYVRFFEPMTKAEQAALQGRFDVAFQFFQEALRVAQSAADPDLVTGCWSAMGSTHMRLMRYPESLDCFLRALESARKVHGKPKGLAVCLRNAGEAYRMLDNPSAAIPLCEEALALYRQLEDPEGIASLTRALARNHLALGSLKTAQRFFEDALRAYRSLGNKGGAADCERALIEVSTRLRSGEAGLR